MTGNGRWHTEFDGDRWWADEHPDLEEPLSGCAGIGVGLILASAVWALLWLLWRAW